ncbi:MAG: tryptophan--tRNA ligase [Clostridiaceae bacterium]
MSELTLKQAKKKIVFSGIQPSGNLTIGNYLGAIKNWVNNQDLYENVFCIVDMHAITVRQTPADLRRRSLEVAAIYLASGIDPLKSSVFIQSHVPAHAQAGWILTCFAYMGELSRMTQYKMKTQNKEGEAIEAGLFTYPVLMAADILLYQANYVPVGIDQKQHVELTRDLAMRFNNLYSETFTIPEVLLMKAGAKIMDLQSPDKKMSKSSENPNSFIMIMDQPEDIRRKVSRAVTDSIGIVNYTPEQPGIMNLINIMTAINGKSPEEIVREFDGLGYKEFKEAVAETIIAELSPVREKVQDLLGNQKHELELILKEGAEKADYMAQKTLRKMYKKVGFVPSFR